ncbi:MAG: hypothetical protein M1508_02760 [Nitrospirae bacterium]|nr:hypothetical protein [Nitrospirota bacterium]MCL5421631.1 hypothetical protein [Nitrospirota bacterium]
MANRFVNQSQNELLHPDDEELDAIKTLLVYILMKNTPLDRDEIYSYIFGEGKKIIWN